MASMDKSTSQLEEDSLSNQSDNDEREKGMKGGLAENYDTGADESDFEQ